MGISHFGETSMQVYQHATSVHTGKTLLEGVSHTILVDPQTRKPTPYPDEFKRSIQVCTEQIHITFLCEDFSCDLTPKRCTARFSNR